MSDYVRGKSVMITGAGSGFGRLTALALGARGARVSCIDIDADAARETAQQIGEAQAFAADVADAQVLAETATAVVDAYGRIDVLVNNAGIMPLAPFADHAHALQHWHRAIDINFKGTLNGIAAVYDHMLEQRRGQVINVSSIYGNFPTFGAGVYGATKAAINFLSESLRVEARGCIKVSTIKPTGVTDTGLGQTIVNRAGVKGILGHQFDDYMALREDRLAGRLDQASTDPDSAAYLMLDPQHIADAVVHVIDQPAGVSIGDITVRASGEHFIL